jgi:DtxR family Mn-dependent transcriptional regulator
MARAAVKSAQRVPPAKSNAQRGGSEAVDDYLKAIFMLGGPEERQVASRDLALHLRITPASVTNMLQKLAATKPSLVAYKKHHGVHLTEAGRRRALEVVRHHRLIETFLHDVLDYPWDEVHSEAERLEHFISERFEERIAIKLGFPAFDPHGHAIPSLEGCMPDVQRLKLAQLAPGKSGRVESVSDRDPEMLRYLAAHGIRPGVRLTVIEQLPFGGAYRVRADQAADVLLSALLADAISMVPL